MEGQGPRLMSRACRLAVGIRDFFGMVFMVGVLCLVSIPVFLEEGWQGVASLWRYFYR